MDNNILREGNGNPLQYSCLENPMDRGVWQATVHGVPRVRHNLATKPPPSIYFIFQTYSKEELMNIWVLVVLFSH